MNSSISQFLHDHRLAIVSVALPDGDLHAATVHFSHEESPLRFFIQTSGQSLKASPFLQNQSGKAALVIGFSEEEWKTFQLHGTMKILSEKDEIEHAASVHYHKMPDAEKRRVETTVFLEFVPTWGRYTDFKTRPKTIIEV